MSICIVLKPLEYPRLRNYVLAWGEWCNREESVIYSPECTAVQCAKADVLICF